MLNECSVSDGEIGGNIRHSKTLWDMPGFPLPHAPAYDLVLFLVLSWGTLSVAVWCVRPNMGDMEASWPHPTSSQTQVARLGGRSTILPERVLW